MEKRILLVEDEPGLSMTLSDRLRSEGYAVDLAADGESGYAAASSGNYDLIILDIMLPSKSGLDICRDLRQRGIPSPILMLTARDQIVDRVLGLKIGADDYVTKPFEMMELLARIEALLRRSKIPATEVSAPARYSFGNIIVDLRSTEVYSEERRISLSAKEFQLLRYFLEHSGETLSRETLLRDVWGYDSTPQTRTVDVHVAWLRQKLEDDPRDPKWIVTVHGLGYRFTG